MNRYRKKPVVIEAVQWFKNVDHWEGEVVRYFRHPAHGGHVHDCGHIYNDHGWIDTLEGGHTVCPGDWIITGIQGEHYPCKPDIFAATYEAVDVDEGLAGEEHEEAKITDVVVELRNLHGSVMPRRETSAVHDVLDRLDQMDLAYLLTMTTIVLPSLVWDEIAELRPYQRYALTDYTVIARALDRAEARLREVTG